MKGLLIVGIRLMGLWLIVRGLMSSVEILLAINDFVASFALVSAVIPLLAGLALVVAAQPLSNIMGVDSEQSSVQTASIEPALFAMLGVYLVASSIPEFAWLVAVMMSSQSWGAGIDQTQQIATAASTFSKLVIGVALALGATGLANLLRKIRSIGT